MYESPRTRRLRNDLLALDRLRSESSVFQFSAQGGDPPHHYLIFLKGKGLSRDRGKIRSVETHRVEIKLGSSYPRTIPEIRWITPIFHPNISEIGMVCLGGYGTHWVPSVQLDELCIMLWDMARYHNYDIRSPYNRDAALWVASQTTYLFPTDGRSLRDLRAALGRISPSQHTDRSKSATQIETKLPPRSIIGGVPQTSPFVQLERVRQFIDALDRRDRRTSNRHRAGRRREPTSIRQLVERFRSFVNDGVTQPIRVASNGGATPPAAEPHGQAIVLGDSTQAQQRDERADIVLQEPGPPVQPEPEQPPQSADEIIFIE
jgi:ubiquitin-protein ligase